MRASAGSMATHRAASTTRRVQPSRFISSTCGSAVAIVGGIAEDVEDAAAQLVVMQARLLPQQEELAAAVKGERERALDVAADGSLGAVGEEADEPGEQGGVPAQMEEEGRIAAAEPPEGLPRRSRCRPGAA